MDRSMRPGVPTMMGMAAAERPAPTVPRGRHAPPLEVRSPRSAAACSGRGGRLRAGRIRRGQRGGDLARGRHVEGDLLRALLQQEECILALFDEAATESCAMSAASDDEGHASYEERVAAGVHAFLTLASYPTSAQTLLVQIIGVYPRRRAPRCDPRGLRRLALPRQPAPPRSTTRPPSPLATTRSRSSAPRSSSCRSLRTGQPPDVLALEPVITRLMLGALQRA